MKVPLLDLLAAYPAKLDLLNSVLSDSGLSAEERGFLDCIKAIAVQQHVESGGGRLNYQLLFGLREPVRWHTYHKCAIGFHEGAQVCLRCAVLCLTCMYNDCWAMCIRHPDIVWCSSATLLLPLFLCCLHT